jgi:hypothetical protein
MRARLWRGRRRIRFVDILAGFVALLALGMLIATPYLVVQAVRAVRSHQAAAASARANRAGDIVRDGSVTFAVSDVRCGLDTIGGGLGPNNGQFCEVRLTMHNDGPNAMTLNASAQRATGSKGAFYLADEAAQAIVNGGNPPLAPGASAQTTLVYDVPDGVRLVDIDLHINDYSHGAKVRL